MSRITVTALAALLLIAAPQATIRNAKPDSLCCTGLGKCR